jgi:hypothetical protein
MPERNSKVDIHRRPPVKNYMIIKQRVRDLDQFQRAFDKLKPMRERHGLKDMGQYRSADEPDTVIVLLEVADISAARAYWYSKVLSEGRKEAPLAPSWPALIRYG